MCELYLSLECTYTRSGTHISVCLYTDVHIKCVCESVLRGDNEDTWLFGLYGVTFCLKKTKKKTLLVSTEIYTGGVWREFPPLLFRVHYA